MDKCLTGMCFFADLNYLKSENQYQTKTGTYFLPVCLITYYCLVYQSDSGGRKKDAVQVMGNIKQSFTPTPRCAGQS